MELRELKYFLAVAQEGSISAAAEYLFITQPSLSRQMQHLESEVGGPLFVRGSRRITLTERGRLLKKRAEELLELYGKTLAEVSTPAKDVSGEVFIGGGETPVMRYVVRAALNVSRMHPKVKFHFFSGDAPSVMEKLDKGLLDFGVVIDIADLSQYRSLRLPEGDAWSAIMRADDELAERECVTPADLAEKKVVCSDQSYVRGLISGWMGVPAEDLAVAATYNLAYVGSQLAAEGAGYALCLDGIINTEGTGLVSRRLTPEIITHADVIWKKYGMFSRPAELLLSELKICAENRSSNGCISGIYAGQFCFACRIGLTFRPRAVKISCDGIGSARPKMRTREDTLLWWNWQTRRT